MKVFFTEDRQMEIDSVPCWFSGKVLYLSVSDWNDIYSLRDSVFLICASEKTNNIFKFKNLTIEKHGSGYLILYDKCYIVPIRNLAKYILKYDSPHDFKFTNESA